MQRTIEGLKFICQKPGTWLSADGTIGVYHMFAGMAMAQWEAYRASSDSDEPLYGELIGCGWTLTEAINDALTKGNPA